MYYYGYIFCFSFVPVQSFENKQLYFANRLHEAMKVVTVRFFFLVEMWLLWRPDVRSKSAFESAHLLEEHRIWSWLKLSYNSIASAAVVKNRACTTLSADLCLSSQSKGAKEKVVTRIIVSRCEVDLKKICSEYKAQYGQSLQKTILVSELYNLSVACYRFTVCLVLSCSRPNLLYVSYFCRSTPKEITRRCCLACVDQRHKNELCLVSITGNGHGRWQINHEYTLGTNSVAKAHPSFPHHKYWER